MNRANIVIREYHGFDTSDDRCVWFWGDIFKTKNSRKLARTRYEKLVKQGLIEGINYEIKKTQIKISDGEIGKHDISPLGRHAKRYIHESGSVSRLLD